MADDLGNWLINALGNNPSLAQLFATQDIKDILSNGTNVSAGQSSGLRLGITNIGEPVNQPEIDKYHQINEQYYFPQLDKYNQNFEDRSAYVNRMNNNIQDFNRQISGAGLPISNAPQFQGSTGINTMGTVVPAREELPPIAFTPSWDIKSAPTPIYQSFTIGKDQSQQLKSANPGAPKQVNTMDFSRVDPVTGQKETKKYKTEIGSDELLTQTYDPSKAGSLLAYNMNVVTGMKWKTKPRVTIAGKSYDAMNGFRIWLDNKLKDPAWVAAHQSLEKAVTPGRDKSGNPTNYIGWDKIAKQGTPGSIVVLAPDPLQPGKYLETAVTGSNFKYGMPLVYDSNKQDTLASTMKSAAEEYLKEYKLDNLVTPKAYTDDKGNVFTKAEKFDAMSALFAKTMFDRLTGFIKSDIW